MAWIRGGTALWRAAVGAVLAVLTVGAPAAYAAGAGPASPAAPAASPVAPAAPVSLWAAYPASAIAGQNLPLRLNLEPAADGVQQAGPAALLPAVQRATAYVRMETASGAGSFVPFQMRPLDASHFAATVPGSALAAPAGGELSLYFEVVLAPGDVVHYPATGRERPFKIAVEPDLAPPRFTLLTPQGPVFAGEPVNVLVAIRDDSGRVEPSSVRVRVDGTPLRKVEVAPNAVSFRHSFAQTGTHRIEVEAADPSGNRRSATFELAARRRLRVDFGGEFRTQSSLRYGPTSGGSGAGAAGLEPTRLEPRLRVRLGIEGFRTEGFVEMNGTQLGRYGLDTSFRAWDGALSLRARLGSFRPQLSELSYSGRTLEGWEGDLRLGLIGGRLFFGEMRERSETQYGRHALGLRLVPLWWGETLQLGINAAAVSDDLAVRDALSEKLSEEASGQQNLVLSVDARARLWGMALNGEVAASAWLNGLRETLPYDQEGKLLLFSVRPSNWYSRIPLVDGQQLYALFPIPRLGLSQLLPLPVGTAARLGATVPLPLSSRLQLRYAFADSSFRLLGAQASRGREEMTGEFSAAPWRWLRLTLSAGDQRDVPENLLVLVAGPLIEQRLKDLFGGGGAGGGEEAQAAAVSVKRRLGVRGDLELLLGSLRLRPEASFSVEGTDADRGLAVPLARGQAPIALDPLDHPEVERLSAGGRLSGLSLGPVSLTAGYTHLLARPAQAGGASHGAWPGQGFRAEGEVGIGPFALESMLERTPVLEGEEAGDRTFRLRLGYRGSPLSGSVGYEQALTSGQARSRWEGSVSLGLPLGPGTLGLSATGSLSLGNGASGQDQGVEPAAALSGYYLVRF